MALKQETVEKELDSILGESPSPFKHNLALKHETIEKGMDSILGESPSPSKQIERVDYTLVSPTKFALKIDRVIAVEEVSSEQSLKETSEEMSSHDLSAEEEAKDC